LKVGLSMVGVGLRPTLQERTDGGIGRKVFIMGKHRAIISGKHRATIAGKVYPSQ